MFRVIFTVLILFALISISAFAGDMGAITGIVIDSLTGETLPGVSVHLVGTKRGAMTSPDGDFQIKQIPVGHYSLRLTSIGYKTRDIFDIEVLPDKTSPLKISLSKNVIELDKVIRP